MTIKIMTDTAADIPKKLADKYELYFVPTVIRFGDDVYYENRDITLDEYYELLEKGEHHPQTANPTLADDYQLYEKLGEEANDVLNIVISSGISGSYNTSNSALRMYKKRVENPANIQIWDSQYASFGIGLQALHACDLVEQGKNIQEILKELEKHRKNISIGFTLNDLSFLMKGGRLSRGKYFLAKLVDMKPIIHFEEGAMVADNKAKGFEQAITSAFDLAYTRLNKPEKFNAYIVHSRDMVDSVKLIEDYIGDNFGNKDINTHTIDLGPTIITHTGPRTIGLVLDSGYKFVFD